MKSKKAVNRVHCLFLFLPCLNTDPNTVLLSTAYFPPVDYFVYILQSEYFIIDPFETYQKQSFRNRCNIYTEKGSMSLSIPVTKPFGNRTKTGQIQIMNIQRWQLNHWRAIFSAYQNSPYFLYYKDEIESVLKKEVENLLQLNVSVLKICNQLIGIKNELQFSEEFLRPGQFIADHRFDISPKCAPQFSTYPVYTQVFEDRNGFIPNLSILDLLFNLGPGTLDYLKSIR